MRQQAAAHVSTLRDYLQVARRRKWTIVQAAVIVPLAALAFGAGLSTPRKPQGLALRPRAAW
jgi:uncharacterized protein involved in exopolysaccharide biosynthesis